MTAKHGLHIFVGNTEYTPFAYVSLSVWKCKWTASHIDDQACTYTERLSENTCKISDFPSLFAQRTAEYNVINVSKVPPGTCPPLGRECMAIKLTGTQKLSIDETAELRRVRKGDAVMLTDTSGTFW